MWRLNAPMIGTATLLELPSPSLNREAKEVGMGALRFGILAALLIATPLCADVALAQAQAEHPAPAAEAPAAAPAEPERIAVRSGEFAELTGQGSDMAFVSGEQARITAQVSDDIFAVGRELRVEGASADHIILAGGQIDLAPADAHDIIAAGGRIRLSSGVVRDDVVAAGGEINLDRNARVGGSAVLAGGRIRVEAPVGGELMARGGRVEVDGAVTRDARISADEIVIGPQARIGGDLHVRGQRIEIAPGAVVQGRTVREVVTAPQRGAAKLGALAVLGVLGVLVMLGAVAALAPRMMEGVDLRLRTRAWRPLAVGALILLLGPPLILALGVTVLGAPLAFVLVLAYLLAVPLAFAGVSYWIGQFIRSRAARAAAGTPPGWAARVGWTMLAGLLLIIVSMIPILGGIVWLLALAAGIGALAMYVVRGQSDTVMAAAPA
jgi:hypothetical protein